MEASIAARIHWFRGEVSRLTAEAGRPPEAVRWIAVSKWMSRQKILEAYKAGLRVFGENRVQELIEKAAVLPSDIEWHMIGRLQTNKVKPVCEAASLIHSLDRPDLLPRLKEAALKRVEGRIRCLIQVNMTRESAKGGFDPEMVPVFLRDLPRDSGLQIEGLMTIGPLTEDRSAIRNCFRKTRELRDRLEADFPEHSWKMLSMGMSGDYDIAIEEGATLLRIGSLLFGERPERGLAE